MTDARPAAPSRPWDWASGAGLIVGALALLLWYFSGTDTPIPYGEQTGTNVTLQLSPYIWAVPPVTALIYGVIAAVTPASRTHPRHFWAALSLLSGLVALLVALYLPHTFVYTDGSAHIPRLSSLAVTLIAILVAVITAALVWLRPSESQLAKTS